MEYKEISKASRKFEIILIDFIKAYLKQYPTYDIIRERWEQGELLCIDYRTLEISMQNKFNLEKDERGWHYWSEYKNILAYDMLHCTADDIMSRDRIPKYQDTDGIAYTAVDTYIQHHNIKEYLSLPSFLLPTPEEIAEEQERERKYKEEQERKRIEKERIRKEHAFRPDATPMMLIIPDVHGRTFWKKAVEMYPSLPVVFLGDYLDPYYNSIEKIKSDEAFSNFLEILEYKRNHQDKVTLLLGNHDLHYLSNDIDCSRKDEERAEEICRLFTENMNNFQIAMFTRIKDKAFIFSHAGIVPGWLDLRRPDIDKSNIEEVCDTLNSRLHSDPSFSHTLVADASYHRWGPVKFGSPVWADILEHEENEPYTTRKKDYPFALPGNVMQIFGHTQQEEDPVYRPHFACLDCRRPFLLTTDGKIMEAHIGE